MGAPFFSFRLVQILSVRKSEKFWPRRQSSSRLWESCRKTNWTSSWGRRERRNEKTNSKKNSTWKNLLRSTLNPGTGRTSSPKNFLVEWKNFWSEFVSTHSIWFLRKRNWRLRSADVVISTKENLFDRNAFWRKARKNWGTSSWKTAGAKLRSFIRVTSQKAIWKVKAL